MKFLRDKLKLRIYQQTILANCHNKNSLVVLPTGLGKTFIAIGLAGLNIEKGVSVIMAPTKPLCVQHQKTFSDFFDEKEKLVTMTGAVSPTDRKELWKTAKIIFCTPQTFERDLLKRYISIENISFLVLDEAHRATGDYAYVWIAKQFAEKSKGYMLALSASPASRTEDLDEICKNLKVQNIGVTTESDT